MNDRPWSKWFWADWESDEGLRLCSLAAQGLWMRMLCICAKGEPRGYLAINGEPLDIEALSIAVGRPESEVAPLVEELERWGVFSRNRRGLIYSRRIVRDEKRTQEGRKHIKKRWAQPSEEQQEIPLPNRGADRGPTPQRPEARITPQAPPRGANGSARVSKQEADEAFVRFWAAYPRHETKAKAREKLGLILKRNEATADDLVKAAESYARRMVAEGRPLDKMAYPTTWLNQKRWEDEVEFMAQQRCGSASDLTPEQREHYRKLAEERRRELEKERHG